jgi:hypothetical protein
MRANRCDWSGGGSIATVVVLYLKAEVDIQVQQADFLASSSENDGVG